MVALLVIAKSLFPLAEGGRDFDLVHKSPDTVNLILAQSYRTDLCTTRRLHRSRLLTAPMPS